MDTRSSRSLKILAIMVALALGCKCKTASVQPEPALMPSATGVSIITGVGVEPTSQSTSTGPALLASMTLHYEDETKAFDYPKKMRLYLSGDPAFLSYPNIEFGGEMIAGMGDPRFFGFDKYYRSIQIIRRPLPPGSNLEAVFEGVYHQAEAKHPQVDGVMDLPGQITVDGLTGIQRTYRVYSGEPAYEMRDIWLQRGSEIYILAIRTGYTNHEDFAAFQSAADIFLASLDFK